MTTGIETTWQVLAATANEAAVDTLLPALNSPWACIRENALRTILKRRSRAGQLAVLRQFHELDASWRDILFEHRDGITNALRDAAFDADPQTCANGCEAMLWLREYELLPGLVNAVESENNPHAERLAATLLRLAELLYEELALPRDYRNRRDPQRVRSHIVGCLENSVQKFTHHQRKEIIEAFLVLATRENAALKSILAEPRHPAYLTVIDLLLHSERPGVMRLVLSNLDDPHPSTAALSVLTRRNSRKFIGHLLKKIGQEPHPTAAHNLKKIEAIPWSRPDAGLLQQFDEAEQHSLVKLVVGSGMKRTDALEVVEYILRHGRPEGRCAAAEALAQFTGTRANRLSLAALNDEDPHVQAAAVRQMRTRGVPGVLTRLIEMAASPHPVVQGAVRETLSEFRFVRYLNAYDMLDEGVRRSTGLMVKKIDPQTVPLLIAEFRSPVRSRRLRAVAMAISLEAVAEAEPQLREALQGDEDHVVRVEAARALAECPSATSREALTAALQDSSLLVREAAQRALYELDHPSAPDLDPPRELEPDDA